jgi:hypothetical protein
MYITMYNIVEKNFNISISPVRSRGGSRVFIKNKSIERANLVVDVVAADAVGVHEVGSSLRGGGRALGHVRVVFGAPVVPELVRRHQVRLASDHALPVVVARRTQPRVQVQRVPVLEVFCGTCSSLLRTD